MSSQINPNNIDGTYPVAGVPNNTQGFRDNFTNIKTNFSYAESEIDDLQSKVLLKSALAGTTLDNNMNDNVITAVKLNDVSYSYLPLTATSGNINIDYSAAGFQQINATGPCSLNFTNWPAAGSAGSIRIAFNITNTSQTLTLPAAVSQGVVAIAGSLPGVSGVSNTITFGQIGNYAFEFVTVDGGTTIWIFDNSRPPDLFTANLTIANSRVSTSTSTGALVVTGGTGIGGNLNVGGNIRNYNTDGNVSFQALDTGFVQINVPAVPGNTGGAVNIVGSSTGAYQNLVNAGGMLHITGNDGLSSRVIIDSFSSNATAGYSGIILRRGRGTAASPSALQTNDVIARLGVTTYGNVGFVTQNGNSSSSIDFVATENQTSSTAGAKIEFYTTATGTATRVLSQTISDGTATFPGNVVAANVTVNGPGGVALTDGGTVGYGVGGGGAVAQAGNKTQGVTLNKPSGEITMQNTLLAAGASVSFTLTNSTIGARDLLLINLVGGGTAGAYFFGAACATGSAVITVTNRSTGPLSEPLVLRYAVIKGSIT